MRIRDWSSDVCSSDLLKAAIAAVLKDEGYIDSFQIAGEKAKPVLEITLKYYAGRPVIERIDGVSRPGMRIYKGGKTIPQVRNGLGVTIVSKARGGVIDRKDRATGDEGHVLLARNRDGRGRSGRVCYNIEGQR